MNSIPKDRLARQRGLSPSSITEEQFTMRPEMPKLRMALLACGAHDGCETGATELVGLTFVDGRTTVRLPIGTRR